MAYQIVAVNDAAPGACVDVGMIWNGTTTLTATQIIAGTSFTASGTLGVTGAATFGSTVGITGNVAVNTNKFNVTAASGNTAIAGTLNITGATICTAITTSGQLTVGANKVIMTASSGDTAIAGQLEVTGATTCTALLTANAGFAGGAEGDITLNTNKFTVDATDGATLVAGLLTANGGIAGGAEGDITLNTDKFTVDATNGNTLVAGTLAVTGAPTITGISTFNEAVAFGATENAAASGAWAIPITKGYQGFTTNAVGAIAATLADGTVGQRLVLVLTLKDTNNCVVTPANLNGGTTLTFDATGEYAELMFVGTGWTVLHTTASLA